jgi:hypothetical protein
MPRRRAVALSYLLIDDCFMTHPKVVGLRATAIALHMEALCYCARHLTDGFVPVSVPFRSRFVPKWETRQRAILELKGTGLWIEVEGGFQIHDYLDWNPDRASVLEKRRRATERKRRSRAKQKSKVSRRDKAVTRDTGHSPPLPFPKEGEEEAAPLGRAAPPPEATCVTCERDGLELSLFAGQWWCSGCLADYHRPHGLYENYAAHGGNNAQPIRDEAEA